MVLIFSIACVADAVEKACYGVFNSQGPVLQHVGHNGPLRLSGVPVRGWIPRRRRHPGGSVGVAASACRPLVPLRRH